LTNKKLKFAVNDIQVVHDDVDKSQFSLLKVDAFATGRSAHNTYVSDETLRKTAKSILLKPFVFEFDERFDDLGTHSDKEIAGGFVPHNSPLEFKSLPDGRLMLSVNVLIWKRYSGKLLEYFKRDGNKKSVSVEIEVLESKEDSQSGLLEIMDFCYNAITALGSFIRPAIPDAQAVLAFSEEYEKEKEKYLFSGRYDELNFEIPNEVKETVEKALKEKDKFTKSISSVTLAVARYILKNSTISPEKVRQMGKFFEKNKSDSKDLIWNLRGGNVGNRWIMALLKQMDELDEKKMQYFDDSETNIDSKFSNIDAENNENEEEKKSDMKKKEEDKKEEAIEEKNMAEEEKDLKEEDLREKVTVNLSQTILSGANLKTNKRKLTILES